jgi:hypothetical protein
VKAERFRTLARAHGPFASVYYDDSHDTEDAAEQERIRLRHIEATLAREGLDRDVIDRVRHAVLDDHPTVGRGGRAVVACQDVVLTEHLEQSPPETTVRVSDLPYLMPIVAHSTRAEPYIVVMVDHTGADVTTHDQTGWHAETVDGAAYPVHAASSAESPDYVDPKRRSQEAAQKNIRAVTDRVCALADQLRPEAVFVVGEVTSRADLMAALPFRVGQRAVEVAAGARHSIDGDALNAYIAQFFTDRRAVDIAAAAERFSAQRDGETGRATEGLGGVCAGLREGAVRTLIVGDLGDATVLTDGHALAPDPNTMLELGATRMSVVRADEALPLAAVLTEAEIVPADARIAPRDGVCAVLRYRRRGKASED